MSARHLDITPAEARKRLLELVREQAFREGLDIELSSGKRSDFYVDGKKITLMPEGLFLLAFLLLHELEAFPEVSAIGGMTLGADPICAGISLLSHLIERPLPAFIVRKDAKGHGTEARIEGDLVPGQAVAIVEDTITTGGNSLRAIEAVRHLGANPIVVFALVDRMDPDGDDFRRMNVVRALYTVHDLRSETG